MYNMLYLLIIRCNHGLIIHTHALNCFWNLLWYLNTQQNH